MPARPDKFSLGVSRKIATSDEWGALASPHPVDSEPHQAYNGTEFKACYKRFAAATRPKKGSAQCADLKR